MNLISKLAGDQTYLGNHRHSVRELRLSAPWKSQYRYSLRSQGEHQLTKFAVHLLGLRQQELCEEATIFMANLTDAHALEAAVN